MKILLTSDLHGSIEAYRGFVDALDAGDYKLGVIAGDLGDDYAFREELMLLLGVTKKRILYVPGNHDSYKWKSAGNTINIHWKKIAIGRYSFIGYRYTILERTEAEQEQELGRIKHYIGPSTILITHEPALGILDEPYSLIHKGSAALGRFVQERKPLLHLHGHAHRCYGWKDNTVNGAYPRSGVFISIDLDTLEKQYVLGGSGVGGPRMSARLQTLRKEANAKRRLVQDLNDMIRSYLAVASYDLRLEECLNDDYLEELPVVD